jgi:hypothetical protein
LQGVEKGLSCRLHRVPAKRFRGTTSLWRFRVRQLLNSLSNLIFGFHRFQVELTINERSIAVYLREAATSLGETLEQSSG